MRIFRHMITHSVRVAEAKEDKTTEFSQALLTAQPWQLLGEDLVTA